MRVLAAALVTSSIVVLPTVGNAAPCSEGKDFGANKPPPRATFVREHLPVSSGVVVHVPTHDTKLAEKWQQWNDDYTNHLRHCKALEQAEAAGQATSASSIASPVSSAPAPVATSGINWDAIAACESSGNWFIDGTYDGGLQFHPDTWNRAGGQRYAPYAYMATKAQQIAIAEAWVDMTGCVYCRSGWPICGIYG